MYVGYLENSWKIEITQGLTGQNQFNHTQKKEQNSGYLMITGNHHFVEKQSCQELINKGYFFARL